MVNLITQADVESRMGLGTVPAAAPFLTQAILAAHLRIETELDTKFTQASSTEIFLLEKAKTMGVIVDERFRLRLKRGFVRTSPAIVVTCGDEVDSITEVITDGEEGYKLDSDRGFLYVHKDYEDHFVKVIYTYGFVTTDVTTSVVPEAIKEALLSYVPTMMGTAPAAGGKSAPTRDYQMLLDHAAAVLTPLRRRLGFSLDPIY